MTRESNVFKPLKYAYRELIHNRARQVPFWMLAGFFPTFVITRAIVHQYPTLSLNVHGTHVHHFTYGFFVLAIVGFISIISDRARRLQAFCYGVGLALAFDEFGMWIKLTDNYSIDASEDALASILAILVFVVYGIGILRRAYQLARRIR